MPNKQYILALDAGTTSSRAILFDKSAQIIGAAQKEFPQIYPKPGWVEHDPNDLWNSQIETAREVIRNSGIDAREIAAVGITNQRETTLVWDRNTGNPVYNAVVWQDRRTAPICEELKKGAAPAGWQGTLETYIKEKTGLVIDAYFSGTKIAWILRNVSGAREAAQKGDLLFGTVDTWLLWKLTGGKVHATDVTNASRTMLYDINLLRWDEALLSALDVPSSMLPEVYPSAHTFGEIDEAVFGCSGIPAAGIAGDQQAALFGQTCFEPGTVKCTYGTGNFILMNTGNKPVRSDSGLLTTIAWGCGGEVKYSLEGSVFVTGSAVQWLRDEMGLIRTAAESEEYAAAVDDTGGVYVVPAFTGLGAPYWDMYARGTITGITRGTNKNHIIRAVLESVAYQTMDVAACMAADSEIKMKSLKVDGGASANNFLMQFQADILDVEVVRPKIIESTAVGAAFLAGLAVEFWSGKADLLRLNLQDRIFTPVIAASRRGALRGGWAEAVQRARRQ